MVMSTLVMLITTRFALNELGVSEFGFFSYITGFILLFSFLTSALTTSVQRFLSLHYESDKHVTNAYFNASIITHGVLFILVIFVAEFLGQVVLSDKLNANSANNFFVLHLVIWSFSVGLIVIPFDALILTAERVELLLYTSLIEGFIKICGVLYLPFIETGKLEFFASSIAISTTISSAFKVFFCYSQIPEAKWNLKNIKVYMQDLIPLLGWNSIGSLAGVTKEQGAHVVFNHFYSFKLNATYGITQQISGLYITVISVFQTSMTSQMYKLFVDMHESEYVKLIYKNSRLLYLMLYTVASPIFFYTQEILEFWLVNPPEFLVDFVKIVTLISLVDSLSGPFMSALQANGKIKLYQIITGLLMLTSIPLSYVVLDNFGHPINLLYINLAISIFALLSRFFFMSRFIGFKTLYYLRTVVFRLICIGVLSSIVFNALEFAFFSSHVFTRVIAFMLCNCGLVAIVGLNGVERSFVSEKLIKLFR